MIDKLNLENTVKKKSDIQSDSNPKIMLHTK